MMATNGTYYSQISGLTISTDSKNRVIVSTGGTTTFTGDTNGGTVIEAVGTNGELFSVDDDLTGDILVVTNPTGGTVFAVNYTQPVRISGLTSGTSINYLVVESNGVIKYREISGGIGVSGISGTEGTSGIQGNAGLSSSIFYYSANTSSTSGNPGTGYTLWNNSTQTGSTQINIHHYTNDFIDIDTFLATIAPGQKIVIQDKANSDSFQIWTVAGATTNINPNTTTSYWTVPVSYSSSAGAGSTNFSSNQQLFLAIQGGTSGISGLSGRSGISGISGTVGGGLTWTYITTTQAGITNYGFISTATTTSTITLPTGATIGSTIEVTGIGTGAWKIGQNSGQTIHFGIVNSTTGTGGYLQSTQTYDSIRLLCTTTNTDYTVLTVMGNITII